MNYYVKKGDSQLGPYSLVQIQCLIDQDLVSRIDPVWSEELPQWMPLNNVPGLRWPTAPAGGQDVSATKDTEVLTSSPDAAKDDPLGFNKSAPWAQVAFGAIIVIIAVSKLVTWINHSSWFNR